MGWAYAGRGSGPDAMRTNCRADESIERVEIDGFAFPLGVYPIERITPRPGYSCGFEPADGSDEDDGAGGLSGEADVEAWPDRYVFDAVIPAGRVEPLVIQLLGMMPLRVYPILDYMGHDAYREIDPYISYELAGIDRVLDAVGRCRDFFFEDGMCGFGALAEDPFFYVFLDEHKIVTVRAASELAERVRRLLEAFDLEEIKEPAGADSAAHEHRAVLDSDPSDPERLSGEEIVELLRESWQLTLNVDPTANTDDEGRELGLTPWRCVLRWQAEEPRDDAHTELLLVASCLAAAEELAFDAALTLAEQRPDIDPETTETKLISADRLSPEQFKEAVERHRAAGAAAGRASRDPDGGGRGRAGAAGLPVRRGSPASLIRRGAGIVSAIWM